MDNNVFLDNHKTKIFHVQNRRIVEDIFLNPENY